jgi:hypothetical protein
VSKINHYQVAGTFDVATTGNIDDLDFQSCALIRMTNATLATIRGLKAGYPGQQVVIASIGAGQVNLSHQNAGSAAANRLLNFVTSGVAPLAAGKGVATYEYDETTARWRLVSHDQGALIDVAYDSANFTNSGGTWTVDSGDQTTFAYYLDGNRLSLLLVLGSTSVVTGAGSLSFKIPNGYTVAQLNRGPMTFIDNGTAGTGMFSMAASGTVVTVFKDANGANYPLSTNATNVYFNSFIFVN